MNKDNNNIINEYENTNQNGQFIEYGLMTKEESKDKDQYELTRQLELAIFSSDYDKALILLKEGVRFTKNLDILLEYTVRAGHLEMVKYLVEEKNVEPKYNYKKLFFYAISIDSVEIVEYLSKHGCHIAYDNYKLLRTACDLKKINCIKYFIVEHNQDINNVFEFVVDKDKQAKKIINWANKYKNAQELQQHLNVELYKNDTIETINKRINSKMKI